MLDKGTVKKIKIAFKGLKSPLEATSLEKGFLNGDADLSAAVKAARRAFQEIPAGDKDYIPIANGIPGDMDRLFERIDKIQWYVDNNQTPTDCSLTQ